MSQASKIEWTDATWNPVRVQRAVVIHPDKDQPDFVFIYGTRHPKGVEVFKNVEQQAMEVQETSRAHVESDRQMRREGGQTSFLEPTEMPESQYYNKLRDRYSKQARALVLSEINGTEVITYDDLWALALSRPLVWKHDLDNRLKEWCDKDMIQWKGRTAKERTFKRAKGHHFLRTVETIR